MDGVHDMGGMDGFGKVEPEPNEPVFHHRWEGRVLAMSDLKAHLYDPAMGDEDLRRSITEEALRAVPQFAGRIKDQMVFRWSRKVPAYPPGYLTAVNTPHPQAQKEPDLVCAAECGAYHGM